MIALAGGVPMAGYALGALVFTRFELSEAEHGRIRAELDVRANAAARASDSS